MCYQHQGRNFPESNARDKQAARISHVRLDQLYLERCALLMWQWVGSPQQVLHKCSFPSLLLFIPLLGRRLADGEGHVRE